MIYGINVLVIIMLAAYAFIFALIIICLIRISRYFLTAGKEQKLIRMEIGKLAEEVHQLRHELKGGEKGNSLPKSG
jgi:ammonia channel protein AmtB